MCEMLICNRVQSSSSSVYQYQFKLKLNFLHCLEQRNPFIYNMGIFTVDMLIQGNHKFVVLCISYLIYKCNRPSEGEY